MKLLFALIVIAVSAFALCQQKGPSFPTEKDRIEVQKLLDGKPSKLTATKTAKADLRLLRKKGFVTAVLYKNPWYGYTFIYLARKNQEVTFEMLNSSSPPPKVVVKNGKIEEVISTPAQRKRAGLYFME